MSSGLDRFGYWQGVRCIAPKSSGLGEQSVYVFVWEISRFITASYGIFFILQTSFQGLDTFDMCHEQHV